MLLPYLFDATLNFSSSPFDLELPSSVAFSRSPGYVRRPKPVAVFQAQSSQMSIQLPLPFRTSILPDRSAQSVARSEKLTFVSGPFSLRSPQAIINFVNYSLTDHRSRFATVYQAAFQPVQVMHARRYAVLQPRRQSLADGLGYSHFDRLYFGNHICFSFPVSTEMCHFLTFA
jgi:hypothetical protein